MNERTNEWSTNPRHLLPVSQACVENCTAVEWNSKVWPKRGCCVTFEVSCKGWRLHQLSSYNCAAVTPSTRWVQCLKPYSFAYVQKGHLAFGKRSRLCYPSSSLSVFLIQHGGLTKKPQIRFYGHFNHFQLYNEDHLKISTRPQRRVFTLWMASMDDKYLLKFGSYLHSRLISIAA